MSENRGHQLPKCRAYSRDRARDPQPLSLWDGGFTSVVLYSNNSKELQRPTLCHYYTTEHDYWTITMPGLGFKDPAHRANINRSGRPTGAKGLLAKAIADRDQDMPAILDKAVEMAKAGDVQMIAFLLGRQWPAPKPTDHMVQFTLPSGLKAGDLDGITLAILQAVSEGKLAPTDAAKLSSALVSHTHLVSSRDVERLSERIAQLETMFRGKPTIDAEPGPHLVVDNDPGASDGAGDGNGSDVP
jgi:hypothetical protein